MKKEISELLDKLNFNMIFVWSSIVTTLILFIAQIIEVDKNIILYTWIILIISLSYFLTIAFITMRNVAVTKIQDRGAIAFLDKDASELDMSLLNDYFYNSEKKCFDRYGEINIVFRHKLFDLVDNYVLERLEYPVYHNIVPYKLNDKVLKYLNNSDCDKPKESMLVNSAPKRDTSDYLLSLLAKLFYTTTNVIVLSMILDKVHLFMSDIQSTLIFIVIVVVLAWLPKPLSEDKYETNNVKVILQNTLSIVMVAVLLSILI